MKKTLQQRQLRLPGTHEIASCLAYHVAEKQVFIILKIVICLLLFIFENSIYFI